jgi:hypothetical protein
LERAVRLPFFESGRSERNRRRFIDFWLVGKDPGYEPGVLRVLQSKVKQNRSASASVLVGADFGRPTPPTKAPFNVASYAGICEANQQQEGMTAKTMRVISVESSSVCPNNDSNAVVGRN